METFHPSSFTIEVRHTPNAPPDLVASHVAPVVIQPSSVPSRKWQRSVVVQGGLSADPVGWARAPAAAAIDAAIPGRPASTRKGKVSGMKRKKAVARSTPPTPPLVAPARATPRMPADDNATAATNVFDEMGTSWTAKFVHLWNDNTVDIKQAPIDYYGYNELDGGVHDHGGKEDGVMRLTRRLRPRASKKGTRSKNYMSFEDRILIKAWEAVSFDATTGKDETT
ncbi:putative galacturonosyltransferase 14 [Hordeum vulgare]|nr:putative galacturonosyltransferase 14 [Hordeum vulgare]